MAILPCRLWCCIWWENKMSYISRCVIIVFFFLNPSPCLYCFFALLLIPVLSWFDLQTACVSLSFSGQNTLSFQASEEFTELPVGVVVRGLSKIYGDRAAVQDLNISFREGHVTSLLGHNGAGKTTTMYVWHDISHFLTQFHHIFEHCD